MKVIKQIILIFPILFVSLLSFINPASASSVNSAVITAKIELITPQPVYAIASAILSHSQTSNPIVDQMGCSCASCMQAKLVPLKLELQGKLPLVNFL
ncbi:hypothetical protein [Calothrix sp. PCC 6303]|uniref:hypothetical protein n=1 Tax=Calothrix sp. PCC 6303 TaxID=1170562 RepID=UPI0002A0185D|nr:hypothetical protein [Calothrix sp. PCC 6303]AFZ03476.1 hypothetical protein Cal6303_4576 [Calothrix sp. PCC 6303]